MASIQATQGGSTAHSGLARSLFEEFNAATSYNKEVSSPRAGPPAAAGSTAEAGEEGMDDEVALAMFREPRTMFDVLTIDRRNCRRRPLTEIISVHVDDGGEVSPRKLGAVAAGQVDFLHGREFVGQLVAYFLGETNKEIRRVQGESSPGMTPGQLEEAALKLKGLFTLAVQRLQTMESTKVEGDPLFVGQAHNGPFVVHFELTITRSQLEDLEGVCARVVRRTLNREGLADHDIHEVVSVGPATWNLESSVLGSSSAQVADMDVAFSTPPRPERVPVAAVEEMPAPAPALSWMSRRTVCAIALGVAALGAVGLAAGFARRRRWR